MTIRLCAGCSCVLQEMATDDGFCSLECREETRLYHAGGEAIPPRKEPTMTERIVGCEALHAALRDRGYTANVAQTGWGRPTVCVLFAQEVALVAAERRTWTGEATGEWVWWLEDADGPLTGRSSPAIDGWALLDVVEREQNRHGGQYWTTDHGDPEPEEASDA